MGSLIINVEIESEKVVLVNTYTQYLVTHCGSTQILERSLFLVFHTLFIEKH